MSAKKYIGTKKPNPPYSKGNLGIIFIEEEDGNYYTIDGKGYLEAWQVACDLKNGYLRELKEGEKNEFCI